MAPATTVRPGDTFGRLTIVSEVKGKSRRYFFCNCECGGSATVVLHKLMSGTTKSCGCFRREVTGARTRRHGMSEQPEHHCWLKIQQRCFNPNDEKYPDYGARGITVCDRWRLSFENFLEDMGTRPTDRHSIDRENVNGNYEPGNCRWATATEQARNKRNNRMLTFNGETLCLAEWAERIGLDTRVIYKRLRRGWSVDEALSIRLRLPSDSRRSLK